MRRGPRAAPERRESSTFSRESCRPPFTSEERFQLRVDALDVLLAPLEVRPSAGLGDPLQDFRVDVAAVADREDPGARVPGDDLRAGLEPRDDVAEPERRVEVLAVREDDDGDDRV